MADSKSTYFSPGNRGAAAILSNAWETPIKMAERRLAMQEQREWARQQQEAKLRQEQEQQALNSFNSLKVDTSGMLPEDVVRVTEKYHNLVRMAADSRANNVDPFDPRNRDQYLALTKGRTDLEGEVNAAKGFAANTIKQRDLLQTKPGEYNKARFATRFQEEMGKDPLQRQQLTLDAYYDPTSYYGQVLKQPGFDEEEKIITGSGNRGQVSVTKQKGRSEERRQAAVNAMISNPGHRDRMATVYESLAPDEKATFTDFNDYLVKHAQAFVPAGFKAVDYKITGAPNPAPSTAGKGKVDAQEGIDGRYALLKKIINGDDPSAKGMINGTHLGKKIQNVQVVPIMPPSPNNSILERLNPFAPLKPTPTEPIGYKIKLTLDAGEVPQVKESGRKDDALPKVPKTIDVELDPVDAANIIPTLNNIVNSRNGEKKIRTEDIYDLFNKDTSNKNKTKGKYDTFIPAKSSPKKSTGAADNLF